MIMEGYTKNKVMIQREGYHMPDPENAKKKKDKKKDSFQPKTTMSMMRERAEQQWADYDIGTQTEDEMVEEIFIRAKKYERVVVRLQRIWRIANVPRAARRIWRRKFAVLLIQKRFRGIFGRAYAVLFKKLRPPAAARIQRMFRNYKSRYIRRAWKKWSFRLTRWVLPKIKRFLRNCFLSWSARHNYQANQIQKIGRGFIARARFYKMIGERYYLADEPPSYPNIKPFYKGLRQGGGGGMSGRQFHKAATNIQRIMRGRWGKRRFNSFIEAMLVKRIDIPASIKLQRIYRGYRGRLIAIQKAKELRACIKIQKRARWYVRQVWAAQVAYHKKLKLAACQIQRMYRGRLDRDIFRRRKARHWYYNIYIPAIIMVQKIYRRYAARNLISYLRNRNHAATVIQRARRNCLARREAWIKIKAMKLVFLNLTAATIQKIVRRFLARLKYPELLLKRSGRVTLAARRILRAWMNFKMAKRLQILLDDNRVNVYTARLKKILSTRELVEEDIKEMHQDIQLVKEALERIKKRAKEIDLFIIQSDMRIPKVQEEMINVTPEDALKGWAEAFGQEFEMLNHQQAMAREEMRLLNASKRARNKELNRLYWELEEAEMEINHLSMMEVEMYEALRRAEVGRIERRVNDKKNKALRLERCKWKIDSNRMNVIKRNRDGYANIVESVKKDRDLKYAMTLSYEYKQQRRDKEEIIIERLLKENGTKAGAHFKTYTEYAGGIQATYDKALENAMELLRGFTLDERARRIKETHKEAIAAKKKMMGGQFAALKEQFQDPRTGNYIGPPTDMTL